LAKDVNIVYGARDPSDDDDLEFSEDGFLQKSFSRDLRLDGTNNSEFVYGTSGVDYATMRLGNDTYYGFGGNDRLFGHGGTDYLDGGDGNDIFEIGSFGTGISGAAGKADDGKPEWIISAADAAATGVTNGVTNVTDYGNKFDVIVGGAGTDTLRITAGIGATNAQNGTVVLSDATFKQTERVEVGGTAPRTPMRARTSSWLTGTSILLAPQRCLICQPAQADLRETPSTTWL
jgi:Ca2+-binding RTX toxin-like protein